MSQRHTPNTYAQSIINLIEEEETTLSSGSPRTNILVEALAGSGKSTLIEELVIRLADWSPSRITCVLAFNKAIATSMQERLNRSCPRPDLISCMTLNALGHRALGKSDIFMGKRINVDAGKCRDRIYSILDDLGEDCPFISDDVNTLDRLIGLAKSRTPTKKPIDWEAIAEMVDEDYQEQWGEILDDIFKWSIQKAKDEAVIDFNDQLFLPVLWQLPLTKYHNIFVDESQDLSPVQIELISQLMIPSSRIVAVGDRRQSIYAFRGADSAAMQLLVDKFAMKLMPLNVCYRCDTAIITAAQQFVPEIEARPSAGPGHVEVLNDLFTAGDVIEYIFGMNLDSHRPLVLCRYNGPLFAAAFTCILTNRPFTFNNAQFSKTLTAFVHKAIRQSGKDPYRWEGSSSDVLIICRQYAEKEKTKLIARRRYTAAEGIDERLSVIAYLTDFCETWAIMKQNIVNLCSTKATSGPELMTIHKSKGLESKVVFWIDCPSKRQPSEEGIEDRVSAFTTQMQQERNLRYVATTRAGKFLYRCPDVQA